MTRQPNPTITSLLQTLRTYLGKQKLSLVSRKLYLVDIKKFLLSLGQAELLPSDLQREGLYTGYLTAQVTQESAATARRTLAALRQLGAFVAATYGGEDPVAHLSLTKRSDSSTSDSFGNYIKTFTNYLNSLHLSPLTIKSYKSDISRYLTWGVTHLGSTHISSLLTEKNYQKYATHLSESGNASQATIERKMQSLARFQAWYTSQSLSLTSSDKHTNDPSVLQNDALVSDGPLTTATSGALKDDQAAFTAERQEVVKIGNSRTPDQKLQGSELWRIRNFVMLAVLILFVGTLGFFGYRQITRDRLRLAAAYPSTPVTPNRQLSFQGRLENSGGTPVTSATNFVFKLFTASSGGSELYTSGTCSITPDGDGVFNTQIGSTCGSAIASTVFTENANVWLEVTVGAETLSPRQQIATVAYALNAETLQGFPLSSTVSAIKNTVVPMNQYGEILVGEQSPKLTGVSGTFQISAPALTFTTATGTNGNITLAPDGTGQVNVNGNTTSTDFFNVSNAQLTTGSLITGTVGNNNTGYKLLDLLSGSSPTSKFSVSDAGLTTVGADLYVNSGISLYGTAVSDGTVEAAKFCTGDGETNCVTDFSSLAGATYWTRTSGNLSPTNLNDTIAATTSAATALTVTQTGAFNALLVEDQASDPSPFLIDQNGNVGAGTTGPDAKLDALATSGEQLRLTYTDGSVYTGFTVNSGGDLTIDPTGGDVSLGSGDNFNLTAATNLIFGGTTSLGETTSNTDSGAYLVGAFDEFSNSNSTNVQAVLKDLDTAITSAASGSWTLAGDSGASQTISAGNTATFVGGTGITTTASATDTLTLAFASTELGNLTWGSGSGYTWTFDAGATDPTLAFASDTLTATAGTINLAGTVNLAGGSGSTGCTVDDSTGNLTCTGTISGSGITASAVPFSGISSATNTTAAMVVGTGASLNYTGSGTINASSLLSGTWAIPGAIGATTPNAGTFTTLSSTGNTTLGDATTDTITFTGRVAQDADLLPIGTTGTNDLGSGALPWDNIYGVALYQNGNAVCDSSGANCPAGSTNYWRTNLGTLSPVNDTMDLLVGSNASDSAKFAVLNVNSGTPTASVSAGTAGAAYLTATGTLATTAKQTLTLGNSTTGNLNFYNTNNVLDSSGNLKLVGHTATGSTATIDGVIASWGGTFSNLATFQDTLTSFTSDNYTATLSDLTLNPSTDITSFVSAEVNSVHTDPANTHTIASAYASTNMLSHNSNYILSQGVGGYYEVASSTHKIDEAIGLAINTSGATTNIGINNMVSKDSTTVGAAIGIDNSVSNTSVTTTSHELTYGMRTNVTRQNSTGSDLETYGNYISLTTDNGGAGLHTAYGVYVNLDGGADVNYSGIYMGGNFGIGDTTPASLFTVGTGDTFQVDSTGDIVKIKNLTYSWPSAHAAGYLYDNGSGTLSWVSSLTASNMKWNGLTDPDGNLTLAMGATTSTFNWSNNTTSADQLTYTLTNTGGTAGTDNLLVLKNAISTATTGDLNTESLLLLDQADTTTNGTTVLDNAILITNSGGSTLTDAIHIGSGAQAITNGINMGGSTGITTDIVLQNSETIDNNTDGTILLTAATTKVSADLQVTSNAYFANGTTYKVDNLGNATFLDIVAADTGNPGLTVGNGTTGYAKVGGSIIYDAAGDLTLDSDSTQVAVADDLQVQGGDLLTNQTTATLFNTIATTLSMGGAATTALNIGNGSGNYTAINLGSGSGTHTINIAGTGATAADTINIGTGGTAADTITIGNNASTTSLAFTSGTGAQTFTSSVTTGTTTSSAFVLNASGLTTGTGLYVTSGSSSTSGTLLHLNPNQTSGNIINAAYGTSRTLAGALTGINLDLNTNIAAAAQTVTGLKIQQSLSNYGGSSVGMYVDGGYGSALSLNDGASNNTFLVADAGVTTLKPAAFDSVQTCSGNANCVSADTTGTFTNNTTEAKTTNGTAFTLLGAVAAGSTTLYVGLDHPFNTINVDIATANVGMSTMTAEYWNGSAWTNLTVTDGTTRFTVDGTITFTPPSAWATGGKTVNGVSSKYWVRFRNSTGTITTAPTAYFVSPTTKNRFYVYGQSGDANPALYVNDSGVVGVGSASTPTDVALYVTTTSSASQLTRGLRVDMPVLTANTSGVLFTTSETGVANDYFMSMVAGFGGTPTTAFSVQSNGYVVVGNQLSVGSFSSSGTAALCWDNSGDSLINDCSGAPVADYAEIYPTKTGVDFGDIVVATNDKTLIQRIETDQNGNSLPGSNQTISILDKATQRNQATLIGIASQNWSDFSSTGHNVVAGTDNPTPIALSGRVPVKISPTSAPIRIGDPITSSTDPGRGIKATQPGRIVGTALENWDPATPTDKILVYVNNTYFDPDMILTAQGDLPTIVADNQATPTYSLRDQFGNVIDKVVTAGTAVLARVQAGLITTEELVATRATTPTLEVATITPLASSSAITVQGPVVIQPEPTATASGEPLLIVDGEIEAASVSARIATLQEVQVDTITARDIVADRISANHIEGLDAKIATLSASLSDQEVATITDRIKARLQELTSSSGTAADIPLPPEATSSSTLQPDPSNLTPDSLASDSATLTSVSAEILTVSNYLAVIGQATITSLDVTSHLYTESLSSKTGTLALQSGGGIIQLADNTMVVSSTGEVMVNGNLTVTGKILAEQASVNSLEIGIPAEASGSALGQLLAIYNEQGESVATIDASGSANLAEVSTKLIAIAGAADSTSSATVTGNIASNATAGSATLLAGKTEITIESPYVNGQTLVYLTPTTNTENKVLFVKAKDTGRFTVAIDASASADISFNWWVIAVK